jgi:hypothetical protein
MILFANDWTRAFTARPDFDTKNESFLRLVSLYGEMGVKNRYFPLALINQDLKGVDPHCEILSEATKIAIGLECRWNVWYFLREVVRIPPVAGPNPIAYIANRGNIAITWAFLNSIDIALIQPRQTGKSVSTDCIMLWLLFIGAGNSIINMITKDDTLRKKNVERIKKLRDLLPAYIVPRSSDDSDNQFEVTCKHHQNYYTTGVSQNSESTANNLGRGLTAPIAHIDEGPFINHIGTTLPAALAAATTARAEAKKYGRPYGNIFTTTAGKKDDRDGRFMYDMIHGGATWTELFYDCVDRDALVEMVRKNCGGRKLIINATFSHRQLGYTDEWLYEAMSQASSFGDAADRDFFNVWTSGTQSSPLSPALNEKIRDSVVEIKHTEITKELYIIRWYLDELELAAAKRNDSFILGLDTSEAIGRDAIAGVIISAKDLSVVGAFTVNETNLIRFSNALAELMVKYPNMTLIPEKKSTGQMIVDSLLLTLPKHGIDPFRRIFNRIVDEASDRQDLFKELQRPHGSRSPGFYDSTKKYFGFNTTSEARNSLYSTVLQQSAKKAGHLVRDKILSAEIRALVVKRGRIDHEASGHDDTVVAWLLANWMLMMGTNLDWYGIDASIVMSAVSDNSKPMTLEEIHERKVQKEFRTEMDELYVTLAEAQDTFQIARTEARLRFLAARIKEDTEEVNNMNALIKRASDERLVRNNKQARVQQNDFFSRGISWGNQKRPAANNPWGGLRMAA